MNTTRVATRTVQPRPLARVSRIPRLPTSDCRNKSFSRKIGFGLLGLVTFAFLQSGSHLVEVDVREDLDGSGDDILFEKCLNRLLRLYKKEDQKYDFDHFRSTGGDDDFPEPQPNIQRLQDEILSIEPKEILRRISSNQGEDCNVFVIDAGKLDWDMRKKCVYYEQDIGFGETPRTCHGNEVVSVIVGVQGIADDVKLHYYGISNGLGIPVSLLKIAYAAEAPAVVTCSVTIDTSRESRLRLIAPLLRLLSNLAIAIITSKGIPVIAASNNENSTAFPLSSIPLSCERVWPIGNVALSDDGRWEVHRISNRGDWVKYFAPGTDVLVQTRKYYDGYAYPEYRPETGTSYSAPAVASVVALLITAYPWMTKADIEIALDRISVVETDRDGRSYKRIPTEALKLRS